MGVTSDATDNMFDYIEEYLYWKNPDKTMILIKEMLKLPLPIAFGLYFLPIRYFLVVGLWITAAKNSPFFKSILTITITKGQEATLEINKKYVQEWLAQIKATLYQFKLPLPFSGVILTLWNICHWCKKKGI